MNFHAFACVFKICSSMIVMGERDREREHERVGDGVRREEQGEWLCCNPCRLGGEVQCLNRECRGRAQTSRMDL